MKTFYCFSEGTCRCRRCNDVSADLPSHFLERCKLLLVDQLKLSDKVVEMLVAGVDMGLRPDAHDSVEVVHVHVYKYAVQTCQDLLALWLKCFRKRNVSCDREQLKKLF